ncbi:MAG TPA: serine hydrolase domain-containing protein [Vicinamibacterales bacterium]|nr:serine hydrolase domain-containing protein [Vicinamibacterales bacterium]
MTRLTIAVVCGLVALGARPGGGTRVPEQNDPRIAAALEPIRLRHRFPALGGAIVTSQGLQAMAVTGVRKIGTDVAATPDDLWHLGSDTKAMTAAVIAKVVAVGGLTWESTIGAVLPQQTAGAPEAFRNITLLQLLSHRAGLVANINWGQASHSAATPRAQRLAAVQTAARTPLSSPPGSKYEYSNLGYVIAAAMAEQAIDQTWENQMRLTVFRPLGMASAGFGGLGTPGKIDQPWPHTDGNKPVESNGPLVDNPEVMGPAGTVHCSLADWAKFIADQLDGLEGRGALLSPEMYTRLHTPPFGGDYAFGWLVVERPWGGGTVYTHAGSNTMNYAVVWMAPKRDFAVLVTTNQGGGDAQKGTDEAAAALIGLHGSGV